MSIALAVGDRLTSVDAAGGALASATLIPAIMSLLARGGVRLSDLDAIAFGRGPGAFTGLRTACSVAQGLAYGAGKPVLPIDTLLSVAEVARDGRTDFTVWALLDARMDEIYAARYRHAANGWCVLDAPMLASVDALNARWRAEAPEWIAGNALGVFGTRLETRDAVLFPAAGPRAVAMIPLARTLWHAGGAVDAALALPLYVRDKVAQTTRERDLVRLAKARPQADAIRRPPPAGEAQSGEATFAHDRPQADEIRRPPPAGEEQSGKATFAHDGPQADGIRRPPPAGDEQSGKATFAHDGPHADEIRRPPPAGDEQSGKATFAHDGPHADEIRRPPPAGDEQSGKATFAHDTSPGPSR